MRFILRSSYVRIFGSLLILLSSIAGLVYLFQDSLPAVKQSSSFGFDFWTNKPSIYKTALEFDPPPDEPPWGAVVIAAQSTTDLSWTIFPKANWTVYEYDVDKPDNEDPNLRFPLSKGNEAMVYLSFIIDNYDDLPWCAVFVHGHAEAWHQEDHVARLIHGLNRVALARQGYISLRCDWFPSCPAEMRPISHDAVIWGPGFHTKGTEAAIAGNWRLMFPEEDIPGTIASPCCAQFAVTRQAIIRRPKSDYEHLREWLITSLLEDEMSGRVLEKLWAYIFTGESVHCPSPRKCACEWFGRCEDHEFAEPPAEVGSLPD